MPKCHKIYPNCIWQLSTEWHTWGFTKLFLLESTGILPLLLYECASHRFLHKPPNLILMINATFKFTSAPKRWLVFTIFLGHHSLKTNDSLLKELPSYLLTRFPSHIFITLHMKVLITNQSDQSTPQSPHSTLTIELTFLKYFFIRFIL